jgi:acyl-CoA hydrolase
MASRNVHTLKEAADLVRPVDTIGVPLGPGQPAAFLHALGDRDDYEDVTLFGALLVDLFAFFTKPGVHYLSGFYGPAERFLIATGADVQFVPSDFRRFTAIAERLKPRVVATLASPPDKDGWMSLSLHAGATVRELERAAADPERVLIVEVNPNAPRTFGIAPDYLHRVHLDQVDVLVESDLPIIELPDDEPTEVDVRIAEFVRPFIPDGATLQTGIGGIPSTIATMLAADDGGDYGVHSEMFTTGLMRLHKAGKITNSSKGQFPGLSITTFALGSRELYDFLDGNEDVRFLPVDIVNAPHIVARNRRMVTINGALTIDLWGQAVADTIGERQFSGIGGHEDFVSVAGFELEDRSLLCLPSTAMVGGARISRITAELGAGSVVTTPRHQLDLVVTEYGVASLRGRTVRERACALSEIAHPDYRDELRAHALTLG